MERLLQKYEIPASEQSTLVPYILNMDIDGLRNKLSKFDQLDDLSVRVLRLVAMQNNVPHYSRMSKEELVGAIHAIRQCSSHLGEDEISSPEIGSTRKEF